MVSPQRRRNSGPRTPRISKVERQRQILAHARHLILSQGYAATTLEAVAAAARLDEAVVRRYYPNEPALLAAVIAESGSAALERWQAEAAAPTDPLTRLHNLAEQFFTAARDAGGEFRFFHCALLENADAVVMAQLREFYLGVETLLAGVIAEGQQTGVFRRPLDPRVGAWELIRSTLGYALTVPLDIPLYAEPDHLQQAIDCVLHCLLKTDV
jgi:AcrR family transcriptional regulator